MTCEEFLARHSDLLDDELPDGLALEMRVHMAGCERCARYDRVLRQGLSLLRASEPIQPAADPYLALQEHMARSEPAGAARRGPAVATVAAAAMVGLFAWSALDRMDEGRLPDAANGSVQRIDAESLGLWANPQLSGADLVGPALPRPARWPQAVTMAGPPRPGVIPVVLPAAVLTRGPYTPLLLQPPDYGQATDVPPFAPSGR